MFAQRGSDIWGRKFAVSRPDEVCLADVTYVLSWDGWAFFSFVSDAYSRMIVG